MFVCLEGGRLHAYVCVWEGERGGYGEAGDMKDLTVHLEGALCMVCMCVWEGGGYKWLIAAEHHTT